MFGPEIFGISSATLLAYSQSLLTPAAGFVFIHLLGLPLKEISQLPKVDYTPPTWVVPVFAHVILFAFVLTGATAGFLNFWHENSLAAVVRPELFLERTLDLSEDQPTRLSITLRGYDRLSGFRVVANGYHVFSSNRDCVASFQCGPDATPAKSVLNEFLAKRKSGGSRYELNTANSLPHEVMLNHYLHAGRNYLDIVSENSGTGGCELQFEFAVAAERTRKSFALEIHPHRELHEGQAPRRAGSLQAKEVFYSGGPVSGDTVARYNVSAIERRNAVCERIRIGLSLNEEQFKRLSPDAEFKDHFLARQKSFVCETIGTSIPGCPK